MLAWRSSGCDEPCLRGGLLEVTSPQILQIVERMPAACNSRWLGALLLSMVVTCYYLVLAWGRESLSLEVLVLLLAFLGHWKRSVAAQA
jgi:hypothetical protein